MPGVRKTRLMAQVNLSYDRLCSYLRPLERQGLLERLEGRQGVIFKTGRVGQQFPYHYSELIGWLTRGRPLEEEVAVSGPL